MNFSSLSFAVFFVTILFAYNLLGSKYRWIALLAASYFFFASLRMPYLVAVLVSVTLSSYVSGILVHRAASQQVKSFWFWSGNIVMVLHLIWLKYLPFLVENLNSLAGILSVPMRLSAPHAIAAIGVSYFVFQGISYLTDIYLEVLEPERHIGRFGLAMSFFPKILQGPIERGHSILPQLHNLSRTTRDNFYSGMHLFIWGLFKKAVIADRLATYVDPVFSNVHLYSGLPLLLAIYLYAFQIFYDFSGYTDMALGLARCFNIRLTQNFNAPYLSTSVPDFWRRWHISFSSWILDYIFKPLQFRLRSWPMWGTTLALLITFLISGIWHGASWCYIVWGGIHGIFLSLSVLTKKLRKRVLNGLHIKSTYLLHIWQICITFNLVCFAWIFFRANTIEDALYMFYNAIIGIPASLITRDVWGNYFMQGDMLLILILMIFSTISTTVDRRINCDTQNEARLAWLKITPVWIRGTVYGVLFYLIAFHGADTQSFIYLQF